MPKVRSRTLVRREPLADVTLEQELVARVTGIAAPSVLEAIAAVDAADGALSLAAAHVRLATRAGRQAAGLEDARAFNTHGRPARQAAALSHLQSARRIRAAHPKPQGVP